MTTLAIVPQIQEPTIGQQQLTATITKCSQLVERAKSATINSADDRRAAGELFMIIKAARKEWKAITEPRQQEAAKKHKALVAEFKAVDDPANDGEASLERKILSWDREQERIRKAEQDRLQDEARKEAEAEARRVAEQQRLAEVEAALKAGKEKQAEKLMERPIVVAPVFVAPVVLQSEKPRVAGESTRQNWKFRITDSALVPREYTLVDEVKIGKVVRAMKDQTKIPGVEVYPDAALAGRVV